MNTTHLPFSKIPHFSDTDKAYNLRDNRLQAFYEHEPLLENFEAVIAAKQQFNPQKRTTLVEQLVKQYEGIESEPLQKQLQKLRQPNCFTVVTAHQPVLFTGPLYYIYKIAGTIHLIRKLNKTYPNYHFVPVFWMGGEDHDFEEMNHAQLFGKELSWQDRQGGPVGEYSIESLQPVLEELYAILGDSEKALELRSIFASAFQPKYSYGEAMFRLVHALFGQYGLVVLRPVQAAFKQQMIDIFKDDLLQHSSKKLVEETVAKLKAEGFDNQAYVREINLFYLQENSRERIELKDGSYKVLNSDLEFTEAEMIKEVEEYPERFSPNVILRPLFQETILPNLAYIGGGGELAYWLERKAQFAYFDLPFPMLIRRNSVLYVDRIAAKRLDKHKLEVQELFGDLEQLIQRYVDAQTEVALNFDDEKVQLQQGFDQVVAKAVQIDPTLQASVEAQQAQLFKSLDKLETRLMRRAKKEQETAINQIQKLHQKLFPEGSLQERKDNFIPLYLQQGPSILERLIELLDPLQTDFLILKDH